MNVQAVIDRVTELAGGYVPNLLGALVLLVVGWLVALIVGALVRGALRRTTLDNRLAKWILGEEAAKGFDVERWVGKAFYYLVLLFVLVGFFQVLRLTAVTEPVNRLLTKLAQFAPRLLGAGVLLAVAWMVASGLRLVVRKVAGAAKLDERLGDRVGLEDEKQPGLTKTIGTAVYWLVFLLFLPAILGALNLQGLLTPVQRLTNKILGFLPNILAAGLIGLVGWFIARVVQRIVTNLLAAVGLDKLGERVGLAKVVGGKGLSRLVGLVVYVVILIPVLVSALNALQLEAITRPASAMLGKVFDVVPSLFAAALLLTVAYVVGRLLAGLVRGLLAGAGFDKLAAKIGLGKEQPESRRPSTIVGYLIVVGIMLFGSIEALRLLHFESLAVLLSGFTVFAGKVGLGLVVFAVGLYLAQLAFRTIMATGSSQAGLMAVAARVSIIALAGAIALRQMGLANEIIELAFGLLLGAVAVAVALAFGLGGREIAARRLQGWLDSMKKEP